MTTSIDTTSVPDPISLEAQRWAERLAAGNVSEAESRALQRWCAHDASHAHAFGQAWQVRKNLDAACRDVYRARGIATAVARPLVSPARRRVLLGVGAAAAASAAAVIASPMLGGLALWSPRADFRTAKGEQRSVNPAEGMRLELNTQTEVALLRRADEVEGIDMLDGEALVEIQGGRLFQVRAGAGHVLARRATFELRYLDGKACLTCLDGDLELQHGGQRLALAAMQRVNYDAAALGGVLDVRPADVPPWRSGLLAFHAAPLTEVVKEINRYRPGRVVVLDDALASSVVSGNFSIRHLDSAIAQIQDALGAKVTRLPGGIVLLA